MDELTRILSADSAGYLHQLQGVDLALYCRDEPAVSTGQHRRTYFSNSSIWYGPLEGVETNSVNETVRLCHSLQISANMQESSDLVPLLLILCPDPSPQWLELG